MVRFARNRGLRDCDAESLHVSPRSVSYRDVRKNVYNKMSGLVSAVQFQENFNRKNEQFDYRCKFKWMALFIVPSALMPR